MRLKHRGDFFFNKFDGHFGGDILRQQRPGQVTAGQRVKPPGLAFGRVADTGHQQQRAGEFWKIKRRGKRHNTAQRIPGHNCGFNTQRVCRFNEYLRLLARAFTIKIKPRRIPVPGPVYGDNPVGFGDLVNQSKIEIPDIAAGTVDQQNRRAGAFFIIMNLCAANLNYVANRRAIGLCLN